MVPTMTATARQLEVKTLDLPMIGAVPTRRAPEAARKWVARNGLRRLWRGGAWLVKRADVDAVIEGRTPRRVA